MTTLTTLLGGAAFALLCAFPAQAMENDERNPPLARQAADAHQEVSLQNEAGPANAPLATSDEEDALRELEDACLAAIEKAQSASREMKTRHRILSPWLNVKPDGLWQDKLEVYEEAKAAHREAEQEKQNTIDAYENAKRVMRARKQ